MTISKVNAEWKILYEKLVEMRDYIQSLPTQVHNVEHFGRLCNGIRENTDSVNMGLTSASLALDIEIIPTRYVPRKEQNNHVCTEPSLRIVQDAEFSLLPDEIKSLCREKVCNGCGTKIRYLLHSGEECGSFYSQKKCYCGQKL